MIELIEQQEKIYTGDGIDELMEILAVRKVSNNICRCGDLAVTGSTILTPNGECKVTYHGMLSLLRRLSVPVPKSYAFKVENDQLLYDVNKLLNEDEKEILYRIEDDVITGFMHPRFQPVEHSNLINSLDRGNFEMRNIILAPHFMKINLVTDSFVDVGDNDRSLLGLEVCNSEIGFMKMQSALLIYRVICSNGAIGIGQANAYRQEQLGRSEETIIESFYNRIAAYQWEFPEIGAALREMAITSIGSMVDFVPKKHVVSSDRPLEEEPDYTGMNGILYLLKNAVGKNAVGKDDALSILDGYTNDSSQYDIYNSITASAKQYSIDRARKVERLGGFMVSYTMNRLAA
jgi:hypothetical protein